jgi:hypothetical protein
VESILLENKSISQRLHFAFCRIKKGHLILESLTELVACRKKMQACHNQPKFTLAAAFAGLALASTMLRFRGKPAYSISPHPF